MGVSLNALYTSTLFTYLLTYLLTYCGNAALFNVSTEQSYFKDGYHDEQTRKSVLPYMF